MEKFGISFLRINLVPRNFQRSCPFRRKMPAQKKGYKTENFLVKIKSFDKKRKIMLKFIFFFSFAFSQEIEENFDLFRNMFEANGPGDDRKIGKFLFSAFLEPVFR